MAFQIVTYIYLKIKNVPVSIDRWKRWTKLGICMQGNIAAAAAAAAKSLQSCPTLCNPIDGSPSGSTIPGILQARTLEWVAISFSNAWKWKVKVKSLSHVWLCATPWTAAYQAPLPMGFSRQEYWSEILLSLNLEKTITSYNTDKPWGHYAKWNKTFTKKTITVWFHFDELPREVRPIETVEWWLPRTRG